MSRKIPFTATKAAFTIGLLGLLVFGARATAQQERIISAFANGGTGGSQPVGTPVFDSAGNLYGVTTYGGSTLCTYFSYVGCGTVFELSPNSGGGWTKKIIHAFTAKERDGYFPTAGLIIDSAGNLYGTTSNGGSGVCSSTFPSGCGTVFELTRTQKGKWQEKILHEFGPEDGPYPNGGLIFDALGNLYGVASGIVGDCSSGLGSCGTVYELMPRTNGHWAEKVLHHFSDNGTDGYFPIGGLTFDKAGNLYGGTEWGGAYASGIAFKLSPNKDGSWTEKHLYTYDWGKGYNAGGNGSFVFDASGDLFSATSTNLKDGYNGPGLVFELSPSGGAWTQTILYNFFDVSAGFALNAPLVFDAAGNLYGTNQYGGTGSTICLTLGLQQSQLSCGTVFKLTPVGSTWAETTLHNFGNDADGQVPLGGLVFDSAGHLFGTTSSGGPAGGGTVFEIKLQ